MVSQETQNEIARIDREISELVEKRLKLTTESESVMTRSEAALAGRRYEREILNGIEYDGDPSLESCERVMFQTLFNLSHSYSASNLTKRSELADIIAKALKETPKEFPKNALVACQGVEGAYSQIAADKLFPGADIMYFRTFDGVFQAVESGFCKYGLLPIENSSYGSVTQVYDLMKSHRFHIIRSLKLQISHRLLAKPGTEFKDIKEIVSHEQALGQCSRFLKDNRDIKVTVVENTAMAAQAVADSDRTDIAAISSQDCSALYGLEVIRDDIQNSDHNYTRFICISKDLEIYPGANKASIMLALDHTPGSLSNTLARFSSLGLNLTKIESRPISGRDFEFMFYLDVDASIYSEPFVTLLCQLDNDPAAFTFLGSYSEV
ncbi:MAG: bifunctional chorismate mutase/prephenate dehydratase [Clostridiales bacterium]|nr:bifunctional chorismate mutase/prephenate dehydratase [Clostridiales bacterium]